MALGASCGNVVSLILNEALILSCCRFARCRIRPGPDRSSLRGPCLAADSPGSRFHGLCRNRSRFRCPQSSFDGRRLSPGARAGAAEPRRALRLTDEKSLSPQIRRVQTVGTGRSGRDRRDGTGGPGQLGRDDGAGTTDPRQRTKDNGARNRRSTKQSNGSSAPAQSLQSRHGRA